MALRCIPPLTELGLRYVLGWKLIYEVFGFQAIGSNDSNFDFNSIILTVGMPHFPTDQQVWSCQKQECYINAVIATQGFHRLLQGEICVVLAKEVDRVSAAESFQKCPGSEVPIIYQDRHQNRFSDLH